MAESSLPEREGYIYLGSVSVDTGTLMISDPHYVLHHADDNDEENIEALREEGIEFEDLYPTYENVIEAMGDSMAAQLRETTALVFHAGYGDGEYPVFGKMNDEGRLVEVVIDMGMTPFQRALFERNDF